MNLKLLTKEDYIIAQKLYCESFNKKETNISIPLLGEIIGLYLKNELIGIAQIDYLNNLFENKKQAIINSFCIKKEYRNKGYGNYLLNGCINYLKEKDIKEITITSNKNRIYAHKLYKKNNFQIIDTIFLKKDLNEKKSTAI